MSRFRIVVGPIVVCFAILAGCKEDKSPLQTQSNRSRSSRGPIDEPEAPATAAEREEALRRLNKAIEAHGGAERLARLSVCVQKLKGMLRDMPSEQELKTALPDRLRLSIQQTTPMGATVNSSLGLHKNKGWYAAHSNITDMDEDVVADVTGELHLRKVLALLPLREKEFDLKPAPGVDVEGMPTFGIRALHKVWPAVNLYFDQKSSLLARSAGRFSEAGVVSMREITFTEYMTFDSIQLPTKIAETRDSAPFQKATISYSFPAKIADKEFDEP